jgi:hypothetical protein
MNVILLTVLALSGTGGESQVAPQDDTAGIYADGQECVSGHSRKLHGAVLHGGCMGPMPQTCYEPPYGCYHGSRWNNRYPAFHATYYRKAYNYRNYFDYPWHAEMHEPTSQWSYNVTGDTGAPAPLPSVISPEGAHPGAEKQAPPPPMPTQASAELPLVEEVRAGLTQPKQAKVPANSLRTLRR